MRLKYSFQGKDRMFARDAAEKPVEEKGGVDNRREAAPALGQLRVVVRCLPTINFSLVHCDQPILTEVSLTNEGADVLTGLQLQLLLPGYADSELVSLPS